MALTSGNSLKPDSRSPKFKAVADDSISTMVSSLGAQMISDSINSRPNLRERTSVTDVSMAGSVQVTNPPSGSSSMSSTPSCSIASSKTSDSVGPPSFALKIVRPRFVK
uniref:Uncharacterized protein n=1 Tax=Bionectria ochroleuca TaxID=29856 RepID=A0A8H7NA85_BIOOC